MGTTLDQRWLVLIWQRPSHEHPLLSLLQCTKDRFSDSEMAPVQPWLHAGKHMDEMKGERPAVHVEEMLQQGNNSL